jgi:hypothetical protein
MMFLAGSIFFVGGILTSLSLTEQLNWFLFVPYPANFVQGLFLELSFLVTGFFLIVVGMGVGLHYYRDRSWYMRELRKANAESLMGVQGVQAVQTVSRTHAMPKRKKMSR